MDPSFESQERISPVQKIDLLNGHERPHSVEIEIPGEHLGQGNWEEMVNKTQTDGRERGVMVGDFFGKLITSDIFSGTSEKESPNASITPHFNVFGWKYLAARKAVFIHSHPKPDELSHLQTTMFSNGDFRSFFNSTLKSLVMVDPGGVHVLLRDDNSLIQIETPKEDFVGEAMKYAEDRNGLVVEAMKKMGNMFARHNFYYYYSPKLSHEDGVVKLKDVRYLEIPKTD